MLMDDDGIQLLSCGFDVILYVVESLFDVWLYFSYALYHVISKL
jgi:hypothetical protein